jgi:thiamine-phosphate pyrophosphorylase
VKTPIVCLVTDRRALGGRALIPWLREAACAGVDLIHIRERDLGDRDLVALVRDAVGAVRGTAARVVVNDRFDVALAAEAAGVHLRADSAAAPRVRSIAPAGFIVGRSVHGEEEAVAVAAAGGCDYLTFGTVFTSTSKAAGHQPAGMAALRRVCAGVRLPVVAIGGISIEGAAAVAAVGAAGVAAISLFIEAPDLGVTVRALRQALTPDREVV